MRLPVLLIGSAWACLIIQFLFCCVITVVNWATPFPGDEYKTLLAGSVSLSFTACLLLGVAWRGLWTDNAKAQLWDNQWQ
jgi:hypothetical protein